MYVALMDSKPVHLILTLDTAEPIELGAFVGAFTSLSAQFERFVRDKHPDLKEEATFFVKEVRTGSTIVEMIPSFIYAAPFLAMADQILIAEDFVLRWGGRLKLLFTGKPPEEISSKAELETFADAVKAIAQDPNASHKLEVATFEDGKREIRAAFRFTTQEARQAQVAINSRILQLDTPHNEERLRVLMVFTRSDINSVNLGKRSGELVRIEAISDRALPLMYGSAMAEQQIKHEVREADDNVFKKGFVVDVIIQMRGEKPVAYAVSHIHQVIDLPD